MSFRDEINSIPYTASTTNGGGFLPPVMRAIVHIVYLTGCLADTEVAVSLQDANVELAAAQEHFDARVDASEAVSTTCLELANTLSSAIHEARNEYEYWPEDDRVANLRDLVNRCFAFLAVLDRELVGLPGSDPGSAL